MHGNEVVRFMMWVWRAAPDLAHMDEIMSDLDHCDAGMEGALASVIADWRTARLIAVPTSVGYGASFHGVSALLSYVEFLRQRGVGGQYRQCFGAYLPDDQPYTQKK